MFAAIGFIGVALGVFTLTVNLDVGTAAFTFANTVILLWHVRHTRKTLEPKVDHVERVVSTELEPWSGAERRDCG